jgi:integrase
MKRAYRLWLKNAKGRSEATLDIAAAAIDRFDEHNKFRDFKTFRLEHAISFKDHLANGRRRSTGKPLSKATLYGTLKAVQAFFVWLSREPGYRRYVNEADAAYFRPNDNDARIATARRDRHAPSLVQVQHVIGAMPTATVTERRDRALVALILLTGARDMAVASLKVKHLDLGSRVLFQDSREVKTKRAKTFKTWFFPAGDDAVEALTAWHAELTRVLLFGPDDPLFPATEVGLNAAGLFAPTGVRREHWASAAPIREAFRKAFEGAGLPYYGPHSLRRTLVSIAYDLKLGPRELKAWSQNLGHESILTTLGSYGGLSEREQSEVMAGLATRLGDAAGEGGDVKLLLRKALAAMDGGAK